jgi:predicted RNase H-like nuclease
MGTYVGADWASNGWVAATLDEADELAVGFYPTIWNLWHDHEADPPEQILVDIPIGLPDAERRGCDEEAREYLESRRSSVFWTPIRDAVYEDHLCVAKNAQVTKRGHGISNQTWAIVPRIREVDTFLRENDEAKRLVRESHPEVCFEKLADSRLSSKRSDDGLAERRAVLDQFVNDGWAGQTTILTEPDYAPRSAEDDVLDAVSLAVTAKRVDDDEAGSFPNGRGFDNPIRDGEGLPMEIVYPEV